MSRTLLKLTKSILDDAVGYVLPVASGRSTLPILSCLLFSTRVVNRGKDDEFMFLVISGCDTEKKLSVKIDKDTNGVEVMEEMNIALPAKKLSQLLTTLPKEGTVSLSIGKTEDSIILKPSSIRSKYTLTSLPGTEFPDLSLDRDSVQYFEMKRKELLNGIAEVENGVPSKDVRYYLNGIHFKMREDNKVDLVSTDGHRLFRTKVQARRAEDKPFPDVNLILPKDAIRPFVNLLKHSEEEDVRIGVTEQHLFIKVGERQLFTCLVSGQYPQYEPVIPKEFAVNVEVDKGLLLESIKRCMLIHSDEPKESKKSAVLYLGDDRLKLKATDNKKGIDTAYQELEVGPSSPVEIAFQGPYLIDALNAFSSERVSLSFNGSDSSFLVTSAGDALDAVIMPLKL
jgi:DNA polymerase-3 subunit beta